MSTPNPLVPQGSLQSQGTSNVRVAVATIVAIHVVFFGGLLLQGCKRDAKTPAESAADTNASTAAALNYPPVDTNSLYYSNSGALPPDNSAALAPTSTVSLGAPTGSAAGNPLSDSTSKAATAASQNDPWKSANLSGTPAASGTEQSATPGKEYTVARGDTFARIAKTQGTTVNALKKANPTVDPVKIRPGQKITVPAGSPAPSETAKSGGAASGARAEAAGAGTGNSYTVKSGDTLTKIARDHGVTVGQLRAANNLKVSRVNVGQKLKIPAAVTGANGTKAKGSATTAATTNATF